MTARDRSLDVPTERQYRMLLVLASGSAGLSRTKRDTEPLLRRGWVTADWRPPYYQWVRVTAAGLHAVARAVERFGLPEMTSGFRSEKVCAECEQPWRPKCKCGSSSYRYVSVKEER